MTSSPPKYGSMDSHQREEAKSDQRSVGTDEVQLVEVKPERSISSDFKRISRRAAKHMSLPAARRLAQTVMTNGSETKTKETNDIAITGMESDAIIVKVVDADEEKRVKQADSKDRKEIASSGRHSDTSSSVRIPLIIQNTFETNTGFFDRAKSLRRLKKYCKALSRDSEFLNEHDVFLAKFAVGYVGFRDSNYYSTALDDLSVALLCASEWESAFMIIGARLIPLIVVFLIAIALMQMKTYPGIQYLENTADKVDIAIAVLAIGFLVFAQLIGPLTRPVFTVGKFSRMRNILSHESRGMYWRILLGEICLSLKYVSTFVIVAASVTCAITCQTSIIGFLWTTLAIAWLQSIDDLLILEIVRRFYSNCTITLAATDMRWADKDMALEFWRHSAISKADIRTSLCDINTPSHIKWNLLTKYTSGLGLGATGDRAPVEVSLEIQLIKWAKMKEEDVSNLGKIVAQSVQISEWRYSMSLKQRTWMFKYYPLKASTLPWGGSVRLSIGTNFSTTHVSGVVNILENATPTRSNPYLEELFLHSNGINDEQASVIADVLRTNLVLKRVWMFHNDIGDVGAVNLARMIRANKTLKSLHLRGNAIGNAGAMELALALKENDTLEVLGVDRNLIGDRGAEALVEALLVNKKLKRLWMMENEFDTKTIYALAEKHNLTSRVMIRRPHPLPPVLKSLVRTRLEELKLSSNEWREAKQMIRNWNQAIRNREGVTEGTQQESTIDTKATHAEKSSSDDGSWSFRETEIQTTDEVNDIVGAILTQLPQVRMAEWKHRSSALQKTKRPSRQKSISFRSTEGRKDWQRSANKFASMPVHA